MYPYIFIITYMHKSVHFSTTSGEDVFLGRSRKGRYFPQTGAVGGTSQQVRKDTALRLSCCCKQDYFPPKI